MSRIYWDSMLFIYWLEDRAGYARRVDAIYTRMQQRGDRLITGAFTFGEVLAGVYRQGEVALAGETRSLLQNVVSEVIPFTLETSDHYARIRATFDVKGPDAIHLACAAQAGADLFLTNDNELVGKYVPGIQFIGSLDTPLL